MINKVSEVKKILIIFSIFLVFGCSGNKIKNNSDLYVFTFGIAGYDDFKFCKKNDPEFIKSYNNEKYPGKICTRFRLYNCHTAYYCPNLATETERRKCEQDANDYWLPKWQGAEADRIKRLQFTKEKCEIEALKNTRSIKQ
jgi:hypothetical protein